MVSIDDPTLVRALTPDLGRLMAVEARGVIVTAPGDQPGIDFVSRFFAPRFGVPEDPVTGYQASKRGGKVGIRVEGDREHRPGHRNGGGQAPSDPVTAFGTWGKAAAHPIASVDLDHGDWFDLEPLGRAIAGARNRLGLRSAHLLRPGRPGVPKGPALTHPPPSASGVLRWASGLPSPGTR